MRGDILDTLEYKPGKQPPCVMRAHGARALRARHNWEARDPRFVMILVSAFYPIVQLLYGHFKPGFRRFGDNLR